MNLPDRTPTREIPPLTQPAFQTRPMPPPGWLNDTRRRILLLGIAFLSGVLVTIIVISLIFLSFGGGDREPLPTAAQPSSGSIVVQLDKTYIAQLMEKELKGAGLPGQISNVQVKLVHQGPITITGDDQLSVLGFPVTKHFTLTLQPYVQACQLQVHLLHADMEGISMTQYGAKFEAGVNQQLRTEAISLPQGFVYCMTGVRTEPQGVFGTYSATPTK